MGVPEEVLREKIQTSVGLIKTLTRDRHVYRAAVRLHMEGSYPTVEGWRPYKIYHVVTSFCLMELAGVFSGLLGIGAGR